MLYGQIANISNLREIQWVVVIPILLTTIAFISLGLYLVYYGIKKMKKEKNVKEAGFRTYALVAAKYSSHISGCIIVDCYLIDKNNKMQALSQEIPIERYSISVGDFLEIKYLNGYINIIKIANESEVPYEQLHSAKERLAFKLAEIEYGRNRFNQ